MITRRALPFTLAGFALGASRPGCSVAQASAGADDGAGTGGPCGSGGLEPGVAVKNARDVRNGWGVNVPNSPETAASTAAALGLIGTRWVRLQFDGDTSAAIAAIQDALVRRGGPDPDLRLQLLLNGYVDGARRNAWAAQQRWIRERVLPIRRTDGRPVLAAIEGPNELNGTNGGGGRGPDDATDKTGRRNTTSDNPVANGNFVDWARRLAAFRSENAFALRGVEILSPTILYFYPADWSDALDVSPYVDYGTFHYYAGLEGTGGVPSWPADPDNLASMYRFAQAGICPGRPLVQSEGGVSSEVPGGYAADGRSAARYQLMQLFDHHALGGHRYMIYDLFDAPVSTRAHVTADREENFGQFYGDGVEPKPSAIALHNLSNLLSLGNDRADPRNGVDRAAFGAAYDAAGLRVAGLQDAGAAGHALVMPKSDGSTIVAIWNEPPIDSGSGRSTTPRANPVEVDFGSAQDYAVYDPTGGGGEADFVARPTTAPIARGSGRSVELTLYGTPLLVELKGRR